MSVRWYLRVAVGKGVDDEWEWAGLKVWYVKDMAMCLCTFIFEKCCTSMIDPVLARVALQH